MTVEPTVAAPPSTNDVTSQMLAVMAALSGVLTDYNKGSQIRTLSESLGSVVEIQGAVVEAAAFQALLYGNMNLFGVSPFPAFPATGSVSYQTVSGGSGPGVTFNIAIPSGAIVQTAGGIQFATTTATTLASGASGISVPIVAVVGGAATNVPAGAITQPVTSLNYALFVTNPLATTGGTDPEQLSQTVARAAAAVASIGLASPVAVADAAVGVTFSGQTVRFATCYEPWVAAGSGAGSGTAGFSVVIDDGTGTASSGLIASVSTKLNGNASSGLTGYRPAGVPYSVLAVVPTVAIVGVSGTVAAIITTGAVSGIINTAVSGYFGLGFAAAAQQAILAQMVGNSVLGLMDTLAVSLYASGSGTAVSGIVPSASGRVILGQINLSLS